MNLKNTKRLSSVNLTWLLDAYAKTPETESFFGTSFTAHAGNTELEAQIKNGMTAKEIQHSWQAEIAVFKKVRAKYLLYK